MFSLILSKQVSTVSNVLLVKQAYHSATKLTVDSEVKATKDTNSRQWTVHVAHKSTPFSKSIIKSY